MEPTGYFETGSMAVVTLILSILGTLTWVPTIWRWLRRPKLHGRILSWVHVPEDTVTIPNDIHGTGRTLTGACYLLKVSLLASKNSLPVLGITASITDKKGKRHDATQFLISTFKVNIDGLVYHPNLQPSDFFQQIVFLPENEPMTKYLLFCVDGQPGCIAEKVHLEIKGPGCLKRQVNIKMPSPAEVGFERNLWIPVKKG